MTSKSRAGLLALVAVCAFGVGSAAASPTYYFAEDAGITPPGIPSPSNSVNAHNAFLSALSSSASEGFEGFEPGAIAPLGPFGGAASLTMTNSTAYSKIENVPCDSNTGICTGRFNTTNGGQNWWGSDDTFTITFGSAFSAFGFYGTDLGDFEGTLTIELLGASNNVLVSRTITSGVTGNGSLFFWGFTDSATSYNGIRFSIVQLSVPNFAAPAVDGAVDIIGFDDLIVGTVRANGGGGGTIPEPTTLALLGLGLAGLSFSRRKQ